MFEIRRLLPVAFAMTVAPSDVRMAARADGYAFTMEVKSSLETEKLVMTLKFSGQNLRLEPDLAAMAGNDPNMAQTTRGAYLIPVPNGKVAFVIPEAGTAMRMNAGDLGGSDLPAQRCDVVRLEDLGAGESMLGQATRKYRLHTRLQAKGNRPAGDEVIEVSVTTFLMPAKGVFKRYTRTFGNQIGNAGCPDQFNKFPEGFPLRMKTTRIGPKGPETETMVVTSIKKMNFSNADFAVPPGMTVMDENPFGKRGH